MAILFRCPCGRSMVVDSERAGDVVTCPNCKRALKVPSGKDRGVELAPVPAAAKGRTSRLCGRCRKEVPVDTQICPHCKAILLDGPAPATPAAAAKAPARAARSPLASAAAGQMGPVVLYGGSRASWWSRLSASGKATVLGGTVVFVGILALVTYFLYNSWVAAQLSQARQDGQKAIADGKKLENLGKFEDAYQLYSYTHIKDALRASGITADAALADALDARYKAFEYLVPEPKTRGSIYWRPTNQQEFDQAMADLRRDYPSYRQRVLAVADAGLGAVQAARDAKNQTVYDEKVGAAMEAYVRVVNQSTPQQRAQFTFQTLIAGLRELGSANRNWDKDRNLYLNNAAGYFNALKERVTQEGYPDAIWQR